MDRTSQLGISSFKWWMEIWKCWDSLQPSTFTGIPLPSSAVRRKYELFPSPLWLQHVLTAAQLRLSHYIWKSTTWGGELQTPDIRLQKSEIRYLESRMLHLVQINVGSCPPMVFITNSTSAQLKCLVICHLVSEKMTPHLPRTAQSNNWLRVNFNIQQERMEYICGLSLDMGSYQDGANDDRIVSVNSEEETH